MATEYALITGATMGIGWELARLFARDNTPLILVARDGQRLQQRQQELRDTFSVTVETIAMDLSACGAGRRLFQEIQQHRWTVTTLVNNAGFGLVDPYLQTDGERELQMVHLNILALQELTKQLAQEFKQRGGGRILNVASIAAYFPGPRMAVYYATKAFVLSFSEALYYELRPHNIMVTTLIPGPTRTEFQQRSGMEKTKLTRLLVMMDAAAVARASYRGLQRGKRVVIPGMMNRLSVWGARLVPRSMAAKMVAWLHQ